MSEYKFDGEIYNDDRMFVLYVCKCTRAEDDDHISTIIYHEEAQEPYKWCVITYRNVARYRAYKVDGFDTKNEAIAYSEHVEPQTPLISLHGKSQSPPKTYQEFVNWKKSNNFKEYDYKKMFLTNSINPQETIYQKKP